MILTYTPDVGAQREWQFHPQKLESFEAEPLEECGGRTWSTYDEFGVLFMSGNRKAWRAALWILLRRDDPELEFDEVSFRMDQLTVDYDVRELDLIAAVLARDPDLPASQREHLEHQLALKDEPHPKA